MCPAQEQPEAVSYNLLLESLGANMSFPCKINIIIINKWIISDYSIWNLLLAMYADGHVTVGNRTTRPVDSSARTWQLGPYVPDNSARRLQLPVYWMFVQRVENDTLFSCNDFIIFIEQKFYLLDFFHFNFKIISKITWPYIVYVN